MTATAEPKTLKLPDLLRSHEEALVKALTKHANPAAWPEDGTTYMEAPQPNAIAGALIRALHDELRDANLRVVFRQKLKERDRTRLAQASKVGGKMHFFTDIDLLIEVNWEEWRFLSDERKIALIDHELCYFSREIDDEGNRKYVLLSHDVEEFRAIVDRWGLWKSDLERFAHSVERAKQLDIFSKVDPGSPKIGGETRFSDATVRAPRLIAKHVIE